MALYLYYKGELRGVLSWEKKNIFLLGSAVGAVVVALLRENVFGAMMGTYYVGMLLLVFYYAKHTTRPLTEKILSMAVGFSLVSVLVILVQYYRIQLSQNFTLSLSQIEDYPGFRVDAMYMNPNYYAMMIEFFILICVYRILKAPTKKTLLYYIPVILINFFALYMSGCRTAWVPFLVSVPLMLLLVNKKKLFGLMAAGETLAVVLVAPRLPRMGSILLYLKDRISIWSQGIEWAKQYPLLGDGPMGYDHLYSMQGGYMARHAHNILIDALVNYGIIGVGISLVYYMQKLKEWFLLFKAGTDPAMVALMAGFLVSVLMHGIMDNTIIWPQCALLFFFVFAANTTPKEQTELSA